MKLWLNGAICDESEAVIPATDHGFLYGMGLFETFRTYGGGRPFLLDRHLTRLAEGCAELRIAYRPDSAELQQAVGGLLQANGLRDGYVRLSVSAGAAPLGLPGTDGYSRPNVCIFVKPLPHAPSPPKPLFLLSLPRSSPEGAVRRKSFHYMNNILAKWELSSRTSLPGAEGLFATESGILVEGIVSNLFFVRAGALHTPSERSGCLPGVTRRAVMELARAQGMAVVEGEYRWEHLLRAEEAFVTNSIQEIAAISRLFDRSGAEVRQWDAKSAGPVAALLQAVYRERTERGDDR